MKWINIIGLFLQFLSFWLAAPELLGADTLKRFEDGLIKVISKFPSVLLGLLGLVLGAIMSFYGIYQGIQASENNSPEQYISFMIFILIFSALYIVYILVFYKRIQKWIERIFAKPVIHQLITNNESRKLALITGAILFTLGFVLQFVALLWS